MIEVYQTKFGGQSAPTEEQGNCWQAAVASVMELPLDRVPNIQEWGQDEDGVWFDKFRKWLSIYGLGLLCILPPENSNNSTQGYHLIECESTTLVGEHHVLVGLNGEVIFDPNPNAKSIGKQIYHFLFTVLNPKQGNEVDSDIEL